MSGLGSRILRTTALVMASSSTIAAVGFVKNILAAYYFGTSGDMDAYLLALLLPDIVMYLATTGVFNFIPLFAEQRALSEEEAWRAAGKMITYWLVMLLAAIGVAIALTPQLNSLLAPGYGGLKRAETIEMSRLLLLMAGAVGTARVMALALYAQRKFFAGSASEALFQIASTAYLVGFWSRGVSSLVWGMIFGAFVQLLVVALGLLDRRRQLRLSVDPRSPVVRKMIQLTLPVYVGYSGSRLNAVINRAFASLLPSGAVSSLQYALMLAEAPVVVIASSLTSALFPFLSQEFAEKEEGKARNQLSRALFSLLLVFLPLSVGLYVLARPAVQLLLERGSFDVHSTDLTTTALRVYALGIVAMALNTLLPVVFTARQNTKTPTQAGLARVGANAALCALLVPHLGLQGVALSAVAAEYVKFVFLLVMLRKILLVDEAPAVVRSLLRILPAVCAMALIIVPAVRYGLPGDVHWNRTAVFRLLGVVTLGVVSYVAALALLCREDFVFFVSVLKGELRSFRRGKADAAPSPGEAAEGDAELVRRLEPRLPAYFPHLRPPLRLWPAGPPLDSDSSRLYRLDVVDTAGGQANLALKIFRSGPRRRYDVALALKRQYESLREVDGLRRPDSPLRSPRPFDFFPDSGALVMEWVEGKRLLDRLASDLDALRADSQVRACGEWLREFHRLREAGICDPEIPDRMRDLESGLEILAQEGVPRTLIGRLGKDMADRARTLDGVRVPACFSHCDFSASNILVDPEGRLVVLDIGRRDRPGPKDSDVAAFIVSLETAPLDPRRWRLSSRQIERLRAAFLEGYVGVPAPASSLTSFLSVLWQVEKFCYYLKSYRARPLHRRWVHRFFTRRLALSVEGQAA